MINCNLWLMGGLGNTLFQFFFGRVLRDRGLDVNFIETLVKSNYITRAAKWSIHTPLYKLLFNEPLSNHNVFPAIMAFCLKKMEINSSKFLFYRKFQDIKRIKNHGHVFGYFQDPEIFSNNLELFNSFCGEIFEKLQISESIEQVAHLRFGDHLSDKMWIDRNIIYYEKVRDLINKSSKKTMIITDSIEYCRTFLGECNNLTFSVTTGAFEDFRTLCTAETLIVSSSTFSWWAAHIGKSIKHVYMPEDLYSQLGFYKSNCKMEIL